MGLLGDRSVTVRELPFALSPDIAHHCLAMDPYGHAVQLYHSMQQTAALTTAANAIGADGIETWPEGVEARPDTFLREPDLGPWG